MHTSPEVGPSSDPRTSSGLSGPGGAVKPLTILQMLESDGPGGAETVMLQLSEELRERGHKIIPVGPTQRAGWLGARFRERGFEPETYSLSGPIDPGCVRRLVKLIREKGAHLVHSHEFTMSVYGAAATAIARVPHVMTMHGNQKMTEVWRRRAALRLAIRHGGTTAAVSRSTKQQLDDDLGLDPGVIHVAHNGVPLRVGNPAPVRHEFSLAEDELVLLAVGNLEKRKGHAILLRALARLVQGGLRRPWRLLIAGGRGGPEAEGLQAFIREHDMGSRVHVLTNRADVADLQSAAHVFVMPSLWEGLPLAMLEAMVAGRAIIASNISGIPEAVTTEVEGLLVPPADEEALSAALARVLSDDALRISLGRAAAERGRREFSVAAMADRYETLYRGS